MKFFKRFRECFIFYLSIEEGYKFAKDKRIYPIPEFSYGHKEDFNINILKLIDNNKILGVSKNY